MTENSSTLKPAQIEAVLRYLAVFEQEDYRPGEWVQQADKPPFFALNNQADEFVKTLYQQKIMLTFDWPGWQQELEQYRFEPAALASADLLTLRKLLTAHVRADRFVEGHLASIFEDGHLIAILRRLAQIRVQLTEQPRPVAAQPEASSWLAPTDQPDRPDPNCYWVRKNRLLAGEYPGHHDPAQAEQKLGRLLEAGVTFFLDLTETYEPLKPYAPTLLATAAARSIVVEVQRLAIEDMNVPTSQHMRNILASLDAAIEAGQTVYVHCWGGIGRTGTVVGCYLVRHGLSGEAALAEIARLWPNMAKHRLFPHSPQTKAQWEFVRRWAE